MKLFPVNDLHFGRQSKTVKNNDKVEKQHILYNRDGASLNRRSEIFNTCRHREMDLLGRFDPWDPQFPLGIEQQLLSLCNM